MIISLGLCIRGFRTEDLHQRVSLHIKNQEIICCTHVCDSHWDAKFVHREQRHIFTHDIVVLWWHITVIQYVRECVWLISNLRASDFDTALRAVAYPASQTFLDPRFRGGLRRSTRPLSPSGYRPPEGWTRTYLCITIWKQGWVRPWWAMHATCRLLCMHTLSTRQLQCWAMWPSIKIYCMQIVSIYLWSNCTLNNDSTYRCCFSCSWSAFTPSVEQVDELRHLMTSGASGTWRSRTFISWEGTK